jgi:excisionase family DNA binding protein
MRDERPNIFDEAPRLLTPGEVAELLRVEPKTVNRWAIEGRIPAVILPGGHRRFREDQVRQLLEGELPPPSRNSIRYTTDPEEPE